MKTFDQLYTAWLDGVLSREESAEFEKQHPELLAERDEMQKLRELLQAYVPPEEMDYGDFFTSKVMEHVIPREPRLLSWFGIPRLAWAGAASLATALSLFVILIPREHIVTTRSGYMAQVLKTTTPDPKISATVDAGPGITVINLNGMERIPDDDDLSK
ncbi:MAG: hypothetical protein JO271_08125 [Verrucomicrobia bacterium]|nr:hypothetical protein [Verrucomicrobiota bacterium]MBV9273793.1 hypothetical protein [Verrucomicrobiota bacterium]